jgi:transcription termination/antitermination protein NusG
VREKKILLVGDTVRIRAGAFQAFTAKIEEIDEERATVSVMVRIFGRAEPIELRFADVEKISFTEEE